MVELLLASLFSITLAHAAEPTPTDFAEAVEVSFDQPGPIFRGALPEIVYTKVVHRDFSDLRLFNANGDSVPFALISSDELRARKTTPQVLTSVPYVSVQVDESNSPGQSFELATDAQGRVSGIKIGETKEAEKTTASSYVIDLRGTERAISVLSFDWTGSRDGKFIFVKVEESDDLKKWSQVADGVLIDTQGLQQKQLSLPYGVSKKALRVTLRTSAKDMSLTQISAASPAASVEAEKAKFHLTGLTVDGELTYDTGGSFPVTQVQFLIPEGTASSIALSSSENKEGPYVNRGGATVYNFDLQNGSSRSKPIEVPEVRDRFWKVQIQGSANQFLSAPPQLEMYWSPEQLVFLKNGQPPYRLAIGSDAITTKADGTAVREQVRARLQSSNDDFAEALVGDQIMTLGGPEKREPVKDPMWHSWLLPGILVIAVLLIAQQAWKLMREMKAS